jgi:hypothetical protein
MVLDIQTVHHILKNTAVQNVNKPFVYITDLTSTMQFPQLSWHKTDIWVLDYILVSRIILKTGEMCSFIRFFHSVSILYQVCNFRLQFIPILHFVLGLQIILTVSLCKERLISIFLFQHNLNMVTKKSKTLVKTD